MDVFTALADPVRRALLVRLARGPARVSDLAAAHPISRPAISKHLRVLREAGLVTASDEGRERPHVLVPEALAPVRALVEDLGGGTSPRVSEDLVDGLALEVRRSVRDQRRPATAEPRPAALRPDHTEETG